MKQFDWVYTTFRSGKRKMYGVKHEIDYSVWMLGWHHYLWFYFGENYKLYMWFKKDKK